MPAPYSITPTIGDLECKDSRTGCHVIRRDERIRHQLALMCVICGEKLGTGDDWDDPEEEP